VSIIQENNWLQNATKVFRDLLVSPSHFLTKQNNSSGKNINFPKDIGVRMEFVKTFTCVFIY
jgi:hypothetical protein